MSQEPSSTEVIVTRIRELLGVTRDDAESALSQLSLERVLRLTRRQLLDGAGYLGLTGLGRLTKDVLARQFLHAVRGLVPVAEPEAEDTGDGPRKFDLGRPTEEGGLDAERIPWGYGQDRVTAMVVDPERLYVYWEVTDEAIERTRAELGPGGQDAWLNLRIYDVTGRIFDGNNANAYFDQSVSRTDRQWFFFIGKPTSTAVVELGLKSREGYFVRVARSGRAEFPRVETASGGGVEWLTVHAATGPVGGPAADGRAPVGVHRTPEPAIHVEPVRVWDIRRTHAGRDGEWIIRDESFGTGWESVLEWAGTHEIEWHGPLIRTSWEAGPFPYPVEASPYVEERYDGKVTVRSVEGRTHIVYGPWQVVIRGLGATAERKVLAIWETYRSWVTHMGAASHIVTRGTRTAGGSEQAVLGASELRWRAASEVRLGGASEVYRLGASELRYLGASETLYAGASEWRLSGASELRFLGASEWLYGGASEQRYPGASERLYPGASEQKHLGASDRHRDCSPGYPAESNMTTAESLVGQR
jgi:hypothetical protein